MSSLRSSLLFARHSSLVRGFTIVELLIVVAVLTIVLGLMVNLASSVRVQYATDVTKDLLRTLDNAVNQYRERYGILPAVTPLIPPTGTVTEEVLRKNARQNNLDIVRALRTSNDLAGATLDKLPVTLYSSSDGALRDAWNSPIVFMPRFDRLIGMALRDRPFFVSAGPDRKFLTLEDNFYSYEGVVGTDDRSKP
jgi:prepilin-type N-terminal cleavage/methylation domain-containing protein